MATSQLITSYQVINKTVNVRVPPQLSGAACHCSVCWSYCYVSIQGLHPLRVAFVSWLHYISHNKTFTICRNESFGAAFIFFIPFAVQHTPQCIAARLFLQKREEWSDNEQDKLPPAVNEMQVGAEKVNDTAAHLRMLNRLISHRFQVSRFPLPRRTQPLQTA